MGSVDLQEKYFIDGLVMAAFVALHIRVLAGGGESA